MKVEKVKALRGVCIGVDKHLQVDEEAELDAPLVTFLVGIGAVERVKDAPAAPAQVDEPVPAANEAGDQPEQKAMDLEGKAAPAESGGKKRK